jgi:hypothetical protein
MAVSFIEISKVLAGWDRIREPLGRVIPNLAELRDDPGRVLKESPIQIKVCAPYGLCAFVALLLGFLLMIPVCIFWNVHGPDCTFVSLALLGFPLMGLLFAHFFYLGNITMHSEGIDFRDRHSRVTCPWSLFRVDSGQVVCTESEISLPIQMAALPLIECEIAGHKAKMGKSAQNNHFRISPDQTHVILKNHYLMKGEKLAPLILELGRTLGRNGQDLQFPNYWSNIVDQ